MVNRKVRWNRATDTGEQTVLRHRYTVAVLNLIFNLILIPLFCIIGAAITTSVSYFLMALIGTFLVKKYIELLLPVKIWIKTFIAGMLFVLVIHILKKAINLNVWIETALVLVISGIFYGIMLFLFKIVNVNELKDLYIRILK